jgi:hypothetical protein
MLNTSKDGAHNPALWRLRQEDGEFETSLGYNFIFGCSITMY